MLAGSAIGATQETIDVSARNMISHASHGQLRSGRVDAVHMKSQLSQTQHGARSGLTTGMDMPGGGLLAISVDCVVPPGLGDMNCDGAVNTSDIDPFVQALLDPMAYIANFPLCEITNADINGDGSVNTSDIDGFVTLILNASD